MKTDIWMPFYIGDYIKDTLKLNAERHGVYLLLMLDYWQNGPLVNDTDELSIAARVQPESKSLAYILDNFFTLKDGHYHQKRIDEEIKKAKSRRDSARDNGKKGGRPRNPQKTDRLIEGKPTANRVGNPQKSSSQSPSQSPLSLHSESSKKNTPADKSASLYTVDFESWWKVYPKKVGKGDAFKSWGRHKSKMPPLDEHISIIEKWSKIDKWTKDGGDYIPNPQTWINGYRWDDEIPTSTPDLKSSGVYKHGGEINFEL